MATRPTIAEVEQGYNGNPVETGDLDSSGDFQTPDEAEQAILEAESMFNDVFSDKILYLSEIEDEDMALRLLCRHRWALVLGDTIQSEGQAGTTVNYNVSSATERSLSRTAYGQEFLEFAEAEKAGPNVGVFRTK